MIDHILLDECLSPSLGAVAQDRGVDAIHTSYLGMSRWADWSVARFAIEHDYIVATNNRADFLREYAKLDLHAGLVVIVPSARRERQKALFAAILDYLEAANEALINRVVEIDADGNITVREWSALLREE